MGKGAILSRTHLFERGKHLQPSAHAQAVGVAKQFLDACLIYLFLKQIADRRLMVVEDACEFSLRVASAVNLGADSVKHVGFELQCRRLGSRESEIVQYISARDVGDRINLFGAFLYEGTIPDLI